MTNFSFHVIFNIFHSKIWKSFSFIFKQQLQQNWHNQNTRLITWRQQQSYSSQSSYYFIYSFITNIRIFTATYTIVILTQVFNFKFKYQKILKYRCKYQPHISLPFQKYDCRAHNSEYVCRAHKWNLFNFLCLHNQRNIFVNFFYTYLFLFSLNKSKVHQIKKFFKWHLNNFFLLLCGLEENQIPSTKRQNLNIKKNHTIYIWSYPHIL